MMGSSSDLPTLYTLGPSHFSERARWGLDHVGYQYTEHRLALGPHALFLKARGLPDTTLPVLATDGLMIQGSGLILDHVGLPLTDATLDARFEQEIGPLVRRFIYAAAFASPDPGLLDVLLEGVTPAETVAGRAAWPALKPMIRRGMGNPDHLADVGRELDRHLAWFDQRVEETHDLIEGQFGRAHITAGSLLYPLAHPVPTPTRQRPRLAPRIEAMLERWRERPSLIWVQRLYQRYRIVID